MASHCRDGENLLDRSGTVGIESAYEKHTCTGTREVRRIGKSEGDECRGTASSLT